MNSSAVEFRDLSLEITTLVSTYAVQYNKSLYNARNLSVGRIFFANLVKLSIIKVIIKMASTHQSHHPSPLHSFIPGLKPSFSANPSHRSLLFLLQD